MRGRPGVLSQMKDRVGRLRTLVSIAFACLSLSLLFSSIAWTRAGAQRRPAPTPRQTSAPRAAPRMSFSHRQREHQLACDKCHQFPSPDWKEARGAGAAFPDVARQPEHASCIGCHRQQFFARERPAPRICSVCHVAVSPRDQARLTFPNPPERFNATPPAREFVSDFRISFPHDKHLEVVGRLVLPGHYTRRGVRFVTASYDPARSAAEETSDPKSCAVCHQTYRPQGKSEEEYETKPPADSGVGFWLKKGTFKTAPNHATCFTCHSQESGIAPAPNDCNACHKLAPGAGSHADFDQRLAASMGITDGAILQRWRRRESAGAFRHEGGAHPDLSCTTCHNVAGMNTLDPKTTRVSVESCGACHATATTGGGGALNAETDRRRADPSFRCTKCHVTYGKEPIPGTHTKAVAAAGAD
jgi:nitrate/TMAO reductase-like tetraheme cytochrome c subunit